MNLIDTHAHLYLEEFNTDRDQMMQRALQAGVGAVLLPNIDTTSILPLMEMCHTWPGVCYPMMGLHPTYVKDDYKAQLDVVGKTLFEGGFVAVGEIGIDLYWDVSFAAQQKEAFTTQLDWAAQLGLPVAIHTRQAFPIILDLVTARQDGRLKGVFHCFTGGVDEARRIIDAGFHLGIGGVVTYKKTELTQVLTHIPPEKVLLETDSPYLAPVPHRGKRNESAYLVEVLNKLAQVYAMDTTQLAQQTTKNAIKLFNLPLQ